MFPFAILFFILSADVITADISAINDVTYEELEQLNMSCHPEDSCAEREPDHSPGVTYPRKCSCHANCSSYGTCCIDSPHRGKSLTNHKCVSVEFPKHLHPRSYYMVQSCPENAAWKRLCEEGLDKDGEILRIAPVTSLSTNTTYKNYYCFRCYELTDNFIYWDFKLLGETNESFPGNSSAITLNKNVRFEFAIPPEKQFPVIGCNPQVITDCPESWKDDAIRKKCDSYMAILYRPDSPDFRNVHCALCNSQPLGELSCNPHRLQNPLEAPGETPLQDPEETPLEKRLKNPFSFSDLIIRGLESRRESSCTNGYIWDAFSKKCRRLFCTLPGYVVQNGKCVPT